MFVTEDSLIYTNNSIKRVSELTTEDLILGYDNEFHKIEMIEQLNSDSLYTIKTKNQPSFLIDDKSSIISTKIESRINEETKNREFYLKKRKFLNPHSLSNHHFIGFFIPSQNTPNLSLNDKDAWLIGKVLTKGYFRKSSQLVIENSKENILQYKKRFPNKDISFGINNKYKNIYIKGGFLKKYYMFSEKKHKKYIPNQLFYNSANMISIFLNSYFNENILKPNYFEANITSRKLVYQLSSLIARLYNKIPIIEESKNFKHKKNISSYSKRYYRLKFDFNQDNYIITKHIIWNKIEYIAKINNKGLKVYKISIKDNIPFVCNNFLIK